MIYDERYFDACCNVKNSVNAAYCQTASTQPYIYAVIIDDIHIGLL